MYYIIIPYVIIELINKQFRLFHDTPIRLNIQNYTNTFIMYIHTHLHKCISNSQVVETFYLIAGLLTLQPTTAII